MNISSQFSCPSGMQGGTSALWLLIGYLFAVTNAILVYTISMRRSLRRLDGMFKTVFGKSVTILVTKNVSSPPSSGESSQIEES